MSEPQQSEAGPALRDAYVKRTAGSKVGISEEPVEAPLSSLSKHLPRPVVNSHGNCPFPSPVYPAWPGLLWLPPLLGGRAVTGRLQEEKWTQKAGI